MEAAVDGDPAETSAAGVHVSSLIPQLLFSSPFRATVGKPDLRRRNTSRATLCVLTIGCINAFARFLFLETSGGVARDGRGVRYSH